MNNLKWNKDITTEDARQVIRDSLPCKVFDMPHEVYLKQTGASASKLKLLQTSPYYAKHNMFRGTDQTRAGSYVHTILEPYEEKSFIFAPEVSYATKAGKAKLQQWANEHLGEECDWGGIKKEELIRLVEDKTGKSVLHGEWRVKAEGMLESLKQNIRAQEILDECREREVSVFFNDPDHGVRRKLRYDFASLPGVGATLGDIKTTSNAAPHRENFARSCWNLGYHISLGSYVHSLSLLGERYDHVVIIAVESNPPYEVVFYELSPALLQQGIKEYLRLLDLYAYCIKKDEWPGYAPGVHVIDVPSWLETRDNGENYE